MSVLTRARSGLARAGATRSGYPIDQGAVLPKYALSGVARAGATRSNYHSPKVFVSINGTQYATGRSVDAQKILDGSLTITDILNDTPNTARMTVKGFLPIEGQAVIVTLGSINNLQREFGGTILNYTHGYVGTPANYQRDLNCIDYTWGLNKRKVRAHYLSTTVAAIVADLVATYASGYTASVASDIGAVVVDEISFSDQDLTACLTQLTKAVGGSWKCDYYPIVSVFYTDASVTNPTILNTINRTLQSFSYTHDLSQLLTRVRSEGGGGSALADIAIGETIIPVDTAVWYPASAITVGATYTVTKGWVNVGPQRVSYTGVSLGGGGSLVGPGAAPASGPAAALASGAGVDTGSHDYAITYVTAAGESIAGPRTTIAVGLVSVPSSAPTAGTPTIGSGPDAGSHIYAVTFVNAAGETTEGPHVTAATTLTTAPSSAPTLSGPSSGSGPDAGNHDYAVTFVTSIGETTPGPISSQITTRDDAMSAPPQPTMDNGGSGGGLGNPGFYAYAITYVNAAGETTPGSVGTFSLGGGNTKISVGFAVGGSSVTARKIYRTVNLFGVGYHGQQLSLVTTIADNTTTTYIDGLADGSLGANVPTSNTATVPVHVVALAGIPIGDANVTSRKLYRRSGGAGLKLVTTIANNTATTYSDTTANASLGAAVPSSSTAYLQRIPLTAIPLGGSTVTQRKVYRTVAGGTQLKLLTTLADNTTTTFTDTVTDASLGANVPVVNTATANQVALSSIPLGPATTTQRKVYRTAAGASQLKLLTTIADNTTTTATDSTADSGLGANVPTSDTSGLTQPSGNVLAGSTSLPLAGVAAFSASGGWCVIGNGQQVIRYTGISGNSLTGVPASGAGAIVATIGYNSTATAAPQLTGIPATGTGSIKVAIKHGDPVNLAVIVDAPAAQTALAALIGGDGIQEDSISDGRISSAEAVDRAEAWLALRDVVDVKIQYQVRGDFNTRSGTTVSVNLGSPTSVTASFLVQQVTMSQFYPVLLPTYDVVAASVHFTFENFLRLMRGAMN